MNFVSTSLSLSFFVRTWFQLAKMSHEAGRIVDNDSIAIKRKEKEKKTSKDSTDEG